jgi:hypothetical protein
MLDGAGTFVTDVLLPALATLFVALVASSVAFRSVIRWAREAVA